MLHEKVMNTLHVFVDIIKRHCKYMYIIMCNSLLSLFLCHTIQVNIVPVIAKADTFTPEECTRFKKLVRQNNLECYYNNYIPLLCGC